MGRHKPVRSSWGSIDMEPDNNVVRPAVFRNGQADAMQAAYDRAIALEERRRFILNAAKARGLL
tara:strand:- start:531 stop:722 length:192 start_codon:yes stop_codon:yes gene_type:complete